MPCTSILLLHVGILPRLLGQLANACLEHEGIAQLGQHASFDPFRNSNNGAFMQAAAAQGGGCYAQPVFVSHIASAQGRLRIYNRTFWKRLHVGLLESWGHSCTATVIHAYGKMYVTHSLEEAAEAAREERERAGSVESDMESTSSSEMASTSDSGPPEAGARPRQSPIKVDTELKHFQQAAMQMYSQSMNQYGVANCVLSFTKQGILKGRLLEQCQAGVLRTLPDMRPIQVALVVGAMHTSGATLGVAEEPVREALEIESVFARLPPLASMRALRAMHAYGWDVGAAQNACMQVIREKALGFSAMEASHALALFADLKAPLEVVHIPMLDKIVKGSARLSQFNLGVAERGLDWAKQQQVHESFQQHGQLVEAAAAAVEASRASLGRT